MGLLTKTENEYYAQQDDGFGNYQFTPLNDVINYFKVAYVGKDKLIPQASHIDIKFFAMRALQELSFDTFKSIKSQQIDLPPSLVMPLPHDYINYTKISWTDSSGIKHPLYPTKHTSNPFEVKQHADGSYWFGVEGSLLEESNGVLNPDFDSDLTDTWNISPVSGSHAWDDTRTNAAGTVWYTEYIDNTLEITNGQLVFGQLWNDGFGIQGGSKSQAAWQRVDVSKASSIDLKATATSGAQQYDGSTLLCDYGVVRVGVTTTDPGVGWPGPNNNLVTASHTNPYSANNPSPNTDATKFDLGYVEWSDGSTSMQEIEDIDVAGINYVWVYIQSYSPWTSDAITDTTHTYDHDNDAGTAEIPGPANGSPVAITPTTAVNITHQENKVDFVAIMIPGQLFNLSDANTDKNSSTWNNYKSITPSENNNDDYEDDTYWPANGERYGLDPSHAQVNGSFFIDQRLGKIHFSSNISGKTVILDYISDSLGTDAEMHVHKFAEDAMYKWIAHAIVSTSSYGQPLVPRLTKEKFAAVRKAKLRLSNIKLEEITQILRGKSKQIKH